MQEQKALFSGTKGYIASQELQNSVNVAVVLRRPLLIKGASPAVGFFDT